MSPKAFLQRVEAVAVLLQLYLETNLYHDQATHSENSRRIHSFLQFVLRPPTHLSGVTSSRRQITVELAFT